MATFQKGLMAFVLLLCLTAQARATEMVRNLETISGFDGYVSNVYTPSFQDNDYVRVGGWGDTYIGMSRFSVTSLPNTIYGASLWYYVTNNGGSSTTVPMTMYALSTPFGSNQYWVNGLSYYTSSVKTVPQPQNGNWMVIDITDYYRNWKSGVWQNQGILLLPQANNNRFNLMSSANYTTPANRKPFLLVSYTEPAPSPVQFLSFPLPTSLYPQGAYTAGKMTCVLDHQMARVYSADGTVLAFNGERGVGTAVDQGCYLKPGGGSFSVGGIYVGTPNLGCPITKLNYDGHPGYDYSAVTGTEVKAAASGRVVNFNGSRCVPKGISAGCVAWGAVGIDHGNGYVTQYMHLSSVNTRITIGAEVQAGEVIGASGNKAPAGINLSAHFHFEVLKRAVIVPPGTPDNIDNYKIVDPYGWTGSGSDPLQSVTQIQNVRIWK